MLEWIPYGQLLRHLRVGLKKVCPKKSRSPIPTYTIPKKYQSLQMRMRIIAVISTESEWTIKKDCIKVEAIWIRWNSTHTQTKLVIWQYIFPFTKSSLFSQEQWFQTILYFTEDTSETWSNPKLRDIKKQIGMLLTKIK